MTDCVLRSFDPPGVRHRLTSPPRIPCPIGSRRDGLRLLERAHTEEAAKLAVLRRAAEHGWSDLASGRFAEARTRYEAPIITAIRDAAAGHDDVGPTVRPELGDGVFSSHLAQSRTRPPGGAVHRPRHVLICRRDGDVVVVGRVLYDAIDLPRHLDPR